jgi:hypothetical protein
MVNRLRGFRLVVSLTHCTEDIDRSDRSSGTGKGDRLVSDNANILVVVRESPKDG